jgi:peptidyl-prolyl cis-trans isomerase D
MINLLRKKLSGTFTHIFLFVAVFGLLGLFSLPMIIKQGAKPWVFKVNGNIVQQTQFEYEVSAQRDRIAMIKEQYGQFADMLFKSMGMSTDPKILATDLITKKILLDSFALNIGLTVSESYAQEKLLNQKFAANYLADSVPSFFYDQQGGMQNVLIRMYLQRWGISAKSFLEKVKESMLRQSAIRLIEHATYVPLYEKNLFLKNQHGKKTIELLVLDRKNFVEESKKTRPSTETLKQFFDEKNKTAQTYFVPEKRDVTLWTFHAASYGAPVEKSQIQEYYHKYKTQKFIAKQSEVLVRQLVYKNQPENAPSIASLQEELTQNPSLFAEYAKKYSQDEDSAKNGGLIAPLVYGTTDSPILKAAFALKEAGNVSPVIAVDGTFVIVQLVKKEPRIYKSIDSVSKDISLLLKKQQFKKQFTKELRTVLKDGIVDKKELDTLIKKYGATRQERVGLVSQQKDAIVKAAFSLNGQGKGHLVSQEDEATIVILDRIVPKFVPEFSSVLDTVLSDWHELQGVLALQKTYKEIQDLLATKSLEEIAQLTKIPMKKITLDGAMDKKNIKIAEQYGVSHEDIMNLEKEGSFAYSMSSLGAFFARCLSCEKNDRRLALEKEENEALERANKQLIIEGLIASLHRDAKIETNESFNLPMEDYLV